MSGSSIRRQLLENVSAVQTSFSKLSVHQTKQVQAFEELKTKFEASPYSKNQQGNSILPVFSKRIAAIKEKASSDEAFKKRAFDELKGLAGELKALTANNGPERDIGSNNKAALPQEDQRLFEQATKTLESFDNFQANIFDEKADDLDKLNVQLKTNEEALKEIRAAEEKQAPAKKNKYLADRLNRLEAVHKFFREQLEAAQGIAKTMTEEKLTVDTNLLAARLAAAQMSQITKLSKLTEGEAGVGSMNLLERAGNALPDNNVGLSELFSSFLKSPVFFETDPNGNSRVTLAPNISKTDAIDVGHALIHSIIKKGDKDRFGSIVITVGSSANSLQGLVTAAVQNGWSASIDNKQNLPLSKNMRDNVHIAGIMARARAAVSKLYSVGEGDSLATIDRGIIWAHALNELNTELKLEGKGGEVRERHAKLFIAMLVANGNTQNLAALLAGIDTFVEQQKSQDKPKKEDKHYKDMRSGLLDLAIGSLDNKDDLVYAAQYLPSDKLGSIYHYFADKISENDSYKYYQHEDKDFMQRVHYFTSRDERSNGRNDNEVAIQRFLRGLATAGAVSDTSSPPAKLVILACELAAERTKIEAMAAGAEKDAALTKHRWQFQLFLRSITQEGGAPDTVNQGHAIREYARECTEKIATHYKGKQFGDLPADWHPAPPLPFPEECKVVNANLGTDDAKKNSHRIDFHVNTQITDEVLQDIYLASPPKDAGDTVARRAAVAANVTALMVPAVKRDKQAKTALQVKNAQGHVRAAEYEITFRAKRREKFDNNLRDSFARKLQGRENDQEKNAEAHAFKEAAVRATQP